MVEIDKKAKEITKKIYLAELNKAAENNELLSADQQLDIILRTYLSYQSLLEPKKIKSFNGRYLGMNHIIKKLKLEGLSD